MVTTAQMVVSETQQLLSVTGGVDEKTYLNCGLEEWIREDFWFKLWVLASASCISRVAEMHHLYH